MNNILIKMRERLFAHDMDVHIRVFNVLALGGMAVCFSLFLYELIRGSDIKIVISYLFGIIFSTGMLFYTLKTEKYKIAMLLTVIVIFIGLFSYLFFLGGGYYGGAPCFFALSIVFTAFLLKGKMAVLMIAIELVCYSAICILAYHHPDWVIQLGSEQAIMIDVLICALLSGVVLAIAMYLQNLVYKRKQEELESAQKTAELANRAKSEFIAKMSHDIRTPLNTIMATDELISQNTDSEEIKGWIDDSEIACSMLLSYFNDMVDISKIEAGKIDIHIVQYRLRDLLNKIQSTWALEAKKKGLDLVVIADSQLPSVLGGGEYAINKIISNLISNAIKYSSDGQIKLLVEQNKDNSSENDIILNFIVSDQGIGIPEEFRDKMFVPFERGAQEYYDNREGSGLGLAIVKELADIMSAEITCESQENKGSSFTLTITQKVVDATPIGVVEEAAEEEEKSKETIKEVIFPGARILVVDDNYYNRKVFRSLLEPLLLQVDDVESGEEALEMIEIRDYDLIFMDLRMPKMSGEETLLAIKRENPSFSVPMVVVTADAMIGTKEQMLLAGFNDFLTKPISMDRIKNVLTTFLPDKIHYIESEIKTVLSEEQIMEYQKLMTPYGISFENALTVNEGSLDSIKTRFECFAESYSGIVEEFEKLQDGVEIPGQIFYSVHSLKSSAKGIGAATLAQLTAMIELKKDDEFTRLAMPLLVKEYRLVYEGCNKLLTKID